MTRKTYNVYDNRNRKTNSTEAWGTNLATTTVWHYDGANNIFKIDRPDGISETKGYDALNRMIRHTVPRQLPGYDPINLTTHIDYDPSGTIHQVTDSNNHHTSFLYDACDRKTRMTYHDNSYQSWTWDDAGNLASRTTVHGAPET